MRNLQYEMRICQKSHYKLTKTVYVWLEFLWIRRYQLYLAERQLNTEIFKIVSGILTRKAAGVGYWFKEKLTLVTMFVQNANSIPMIGKFLKNLYHQQTFWGRGPE